MIAFSFSKIDKMNVIRVIATVPSGNI